MSDSARFDELMEIVAGPMETLVLLRLSAHRFRPLGKTPAWVDRVQEADLTDPASAFPFLESFLDEAKGVWEADRDGYQRSGFWTQPVPDAAPLHLTAGAVRSGKLNLLTIAWSEDAYRDHQLLAQRGRESSLALEKLRKEVEMKEILGHSIVHDLAVPINAVSGILALLEETKDHISPERVKLLEAASRASNRQARLVREILDAFAAEQEALSHVERTFDQAPDLTVAVHAAMEWLAPQARGAGIEFDFVPPEGGLRVVGEASRLERVFTNLLENAVRFSPPGGHVSVHVAEHADGIIATVEDQGPGVPEELRARMFDKFVQGRGGTGRIGLGLYFCAMMMHRWGGEISCVNSPSGGARFELRFLRPERSAHPDTGLGQPLVDAHQ
jgi:signal transduction histidine kinase